MGRFGLLFVVGLASWSLFAPASILEFQGPVVKTITASGVSVEIYRDGNLRLGKDVYTLHLTGAGVRKKKLGFLNVDVYVATSYIDLPTGIDPQDPIKSVKSSDARAMRLVLTRDLTAGQIKGGFEDCLRANGADLDEPNLKAVLDKLTFDMPKGAVVTLASYRRSAGNPVENIFIEMPQSNITGKGKDLGLTFWRNWFGIPADPGIKDLKVKLVGNGVIQ